VVAAATITAARRAARIVWRATVAVARAIWWVIVAAARIVRWSVRRTIRAMVSVFNLLAFGPLGIIMNMMRRNRREQRGRWKNQERWEREMLERQH
jgi:hypothetical protein